MRLIKEIVKEVLKIFLGIIWVLSFWLGYIFMSIPEVMMICFAINTGCVVIMYFGLRDHGEAEGHNEQGEKHPAPARCWIKFKLKIVSPSLGLAACEYGQSNVTEKYKNCRHNIKEKWVKNWETIKEEMKL